MKFSVIIPTYDRAGDLRETLGSLAKLSTKESWEVIVVDNNSPNDGTRTVVTEAAGKFPVELRYLFEAEQGRYAAVNAGIGAARGEIIANTDDDARFEPDWLDRAAEGLDRFGCDFVGGRVLPIWGGPRPAWLPNRPGRHWAVIALLDYGSEPKEWGLNGIPWPLGVNIAYRRDAFVRAGLFDNRLGRKAGTLRNQAQREWHLRARAAGLRGFYVPAMMVHHIVPRDRLNKRYFRRWYYWHGISRAIIYEKLKLDMESPEQSTLDYSKVPHVAGVPRYMFRSLGRAAANMLRAAARRDPVATFEHELWLWFFAGIVEQRWKDRKGQPALDEHASKVAKADG